MITVNKRNPIPPMIMGRQIPRRQLLVNPSGDPIQDSRDSDSHRTQRRALIQTIRRNSLSINILHFQFLPSRPTILPNVRPLHLLRNMHSSMITNQLLTTIINSLHNRMLRNFNMDIALYTNRVRLALYHLINIEIRQQLLRQHARGTLLASH